MSRQHYDFAHDDLVLDPGARLDPNVAVEHDIDADLGVVGYLDVWANPKVRRTL